MFTLFLFFVLFPDLCKIDSNDEQQQKKNFKNKVNVYIVNYKFEYMPSIYMKWSTTFFFFVPESSSSSLDTFHYSGLVCQYAHSVHNLYRILI